MKSINIPGKIAFIDLDGTLIDVRERLYRLFITLTNTSELSFDEYWGLKNQGFLQDDMLKRVGFPEDRARQFKRDWMDEIEKRKWLSYDRKQPGVEEFLQMLSSQFNLVLWTNRQNKENVIWELGQMELLKWFSQFLITEHKKSKKELLEGQKINTEKCIVIGDTDEDLLAAKKCGMKFYKFCVVDRRCGYKFILDKIFFN